MLWQQSSQDDDEEGENEKEVKWEDYAISMLLHWIKL